MPKIALIAAGLLALPAPVVAQIVFEGDLTKFTPTKADKAKSDLDKIECRSEDPLGSRLQKHQVCLTKEQWLIYEREEKLAIQSWQVIGYATH